LPGDQEIRLPTASSHSRRLAKRRKRKSFNLDEHLKAVKLWAFDLGMAIVFFVMLFRLIMHEIGH
jgi:hypothetical protein